MENVGALFRQSRAVAWRVAAACWTLAALCLPVSAAWAGTARPLFFSHLQMAQGLSHSDALAVLQDRQGFVWIATESGLNRFDGREVRVYRRGGPGGEGLDADFINGLTEDAAGDLWLATVGGGLVRWERRTDRFTAYRHDPARPDSLASDATLAVWAAPEGDIWVGTEADGLDRYQPRTGKAAHFRASPGNSSTLPADAVYVLAPASAGRLWVGTDGGLALLDRASGQVLRVYHRTSRPALPDDQVRALHVERDGTVWVGTLKGGLARLSADGETVRTFGSDPAVPGSLSSPFVRSVLRDTDGRLWVGTAAGLNLLQPEGTFQHYVHRPEDPRGLPDSFIMSLYQDPSGLLWVGTRSGGVSRWNPRSWQMGHFRPELATGLPIAAFAEGTQPEETLVGTLGGGLLGVNFRTGAERIVLDTRRGLSDDRVMSMLRDRRGRLWIGTFSGGLARQDTDGRLTVFRGNARKAGALPVDGVMSLYEDPAGNVWVGTFGGGVCRYREEQQFECVDAAGPLGRRLSDPRATAMAADRQGRLWVGTPGGGLNLLEPDTRRVRIFRRQGVRTERAGLSDDRIYALHVDPEGILWVGSAAGGLMRVVPPGARQDDRASPLEVRSYGAADGLPSNVVYGIEAGDGDELWLSTANGLVRFSRSRGVLDHYTEAQGLQGADFNFGAHLRTRDGTLFFGGMGGLNRVRPADIQPGRHAPPVVLTAFEILNKPANVAVPAYLLKEAKLGYRDAVVSFEFAALDFVAPEQNVYEYMLEGFDEDWVPAGTRHRVSYTNLDAGDYVLRVRARNADGVPSAAPLELRLQVQPAPWASPWAYAAYGLLVVGLWAYGLRSFRRKRRQEAEYHRRLELTVQERTRELQERNQTLQELTTARSAFVARMSHELRTPMNGVIGIADLLLDTSLDDTQRRFTRSIQQSAQSLVQIVSNILDFSKMEVAEIRLDPVPTAVDLVVEQAVELFAGSAAEKGLELVCASPAVAVPEVLVDVVRFRQVVLNLIGNAVKFTDSGHVQVGLTAGVSGQDGLVHVVLRVEDTGIGIRAENLDHVFDAFQQEDNSTTRRFGGSGLGLTIARQLTELMGGRLLVSSVPGAGSVFTMHLTLPATATGAGEYPSPEGVAGLREVFILDPSPVVREVLLQWLGNWGIRARAAGSWAGFPAERLAAADADDVFIGGDAAWLQTRGTPADTWREWPAERRPRCVLLSGFNRRAGTPPSGLNPAAFNAHLVKPLRWRELLQLLVRLADGGSPDPVDLNEPVFETAARVLQVLVVDDHALNRTIAVGKLAALGHHAVAVAGGQEALEVLLVQRFDLVLMDCQMPGMDGYQASAEIRRREAGSGVRLPIVALTADATTESRERCAVAGMDDFIEKPFARETLAEQLAKWCPPRAAG
jgi:signal transduction histidine kinase/ligand-binding sensor domain-containing protein/CheY-like chemotaxis protein